MTGKEKRKLRAQANRMKATVFVGKEGITERVIRFIYEALGNKELVKIKVLDSQSSDFKNIVDKIAELKNIEVVQVLGRTVLIYRPIPEKDA